jgi:hypothetical protein
VEKTQSGGYILRKLNKPEMTYGAKLSDAVLFEEKQKFPTPSAREPGWKNIEVVDRDGNPPSHHNQRFYDKKTGRVVQKGLQQTVVDPKSGGKLNPNWVCWLMGYPQDWVDIGTENQTSQELQQESKTESVNLKDSETP